MSTGSSFLRHRTELKRRSLWQHSCYRSRLQKSVTYPNPFGKDLARVNDELESLFVGTFAFTGAAAAVLRAPFIDLDTVDVYLPSPNQRKKVQNLTRGQTDGPPLRFLEPYDLGVFMYAKQYVGVPIVSDVQAYLDLVARGGRDQKQADYLFDNAIEPMWKVA